MTYYSNICSHSVANLNFSKKYDWKFFPVISDMDVNIYAHTYTNLKPLTKIIKPTKRIIRNWKIMLRNKIIIITENWKIMIRNKIILIVCYDTHLSSPPHLFFVVTINEQVVHDGFQNDEEHVQWQCIQSPALSRDECSI